MAEEKKAEVQQPRPEPKPESRKLVKRELDVMKMIEDEILIAFRLSGKGNLEIQTTSGKKAYRMTGIAVEVEEPAPKPDKSA